MADIRVATADDHPIFLNGIELLLEEADDITLVGQANTGLEALDLAIEEKPDVLLLDMELPELSGPEVSRRLQERNSPVRVLALSSHDNQEYVQQLLATGASGYITKENAPQLIIEAVRAVADGEVRWFVTPESQEGTSDPDMTDRETEVLQLLAQGYSNQEVADELDISYTTVRKHTSNAYEKIGVESARKAIAWAWQNGIM